MISSFSFLYLRSCEGDSDSLCSWLAMSCSCSRRGLAGILLLAVTFATCRGRSRAERGRRRRRRGRRDMRGRAAGLGRAGRCGAIAGHQRLAVGPERGADDAGIVLGVGTGIGRFEIDDVAEEDLSLV